MTQSKNKRSLSIGEKILAFIIGIALISLMFYSADGPDHQDEATSLNNLAELYRSQGRYNEALPLFTRALEIVEKELGPGHPNTNTLKIKLEILRTKLP